jgi:hypothetical protein
MMRVRSGCKECIMNVSVYRNLVKNSGFLKMVKTPFYLRLGIKQPFCGSTRKLFMSKTSRALMKGSIQRFGGRSSRAGVEVQMMAVDFVQPVVGWVCPFVDSHRVVEIFERKAKYGFLMTLPSHCTTLPHGLRHCPL